LWDAFFSHKRSSLKAKTIEKYENFSKLYAKLGALSIDDALAVKQKLESVTTTSRTKDALMYLSAACKWGMKHKLVNENPYLGMSQEMPQHRYMTDPQPNAFTEEERDRVITAFKTDKRKGMNYRPYAPFVEFLFLCGCRLSEAVGLRWKHLAKDCGTINFEESLVQVRNRRVHSEGSKNNRTRSLAISPRLQALLLSIKPEKLNPEALVFNRAFDFTG
jgi:integrase